MAVGPAKFRMALLLLGCATTCFVVPAQTTGTPLPSTSPQATTSEPQTFDPATAPLPDIPAMMHDVEANQRKAEAVEKNYMYHSVETQQEVGSHGQPKKTTVIEVDHYWVNGVPVRQMVKKNGVALSPQEMAKEDERIHKEVEKARDKRAKADAEGKETAPNGDEEITVSRLLQLGSFTNPRRVQLNGRDTIAVDYTGDPKAKTRNRAEDALRDLQGTAWIDERDHMLARVEGHFVDSFKVGAGLLVDIHKDTRFTFEQTKVNDEVWLPARASGQGAIRALLFVSFNGNAQIVYSDYRKFKATSIVLPGVTQLQEPQQPSGPTAPP